MIMALDNVCESIAEPKVDGEVAEPFRNLAPKVFRLNQFLVVHVLSFAFIDGFLKIQILESLSTSSESGACVSS